jgi:hypothetical protein
MSFDAFIQQYLAPDTMPLGKRQAIDIVQAYHRSNTFDGDPRNKNDLLEYSGMPAYPGDCSSLKPWNPVPGMKSRDPQVILFGVTVLFEAWAGKFAHLKKTNNPNGRPSNALRAARAADENEKLRDYYAHIHQHGIDAGVWCETDESIRSLLIRVLTMPKR